MSNKFHNDIHSLLIENYEVPYIKSSYVKNEEISLEDYDWLNQYNNYLNEGIEFILIEDYDFIEEGIKDYLKDKSVKAKGFINSLVSDRKHELGIQDSDISDVNKKQAFLKKFHDLGQKHKEDSRARIDGNLKNMSKNQIQQNKLSTRSDLSIHHIDRLISNSSNVGNKTALSILAMRHDLEKPHVDSLIKHHKSLNDDAFKKLLSSKHIDSNHIDSLIDSGNERAMKHSANHEKTSPKQISKLLDSSHPGIRNNAVIRAKAILNTRCNC